MSINFHLGKNVNFEELFDGRLERFGIRECVIEGSTSANHRYLTNGNSLLWIYGHEFVTSLCWYSHYGPSEKILAAIAVTFDTEIYSEEEWETWQKNFFEEYEANFYIEIMKHVKGEPNNIQPGTNEMSKAKIAKNLIAENPNLASPDLQKELMEMINKIYKDKHTVKVELDKKDIAKARLAVTHENDLTF